jgi:hypothetical protein
MTPWNEDEPRTLSPEQLAAYADGELDRPELAPLKTRVEEWLAAHPGAAAEVEAQRRLARLWQASAPPEPPESAWGPILARLVLIPVRPVAPSRWGHMVWVAGLLAACAAGVWLTLALRQPGDEAKVVQPGLLPAGFPGKTLAVAKAAPEKTAPEDMQPFPVATADEVEILSVKGADTGTLVVGEPPVRGELVLALPGEVEVTRTTSEVRVGGSPMIWTPLENEREDP